MNLRPTSLPGLLAGAALFAASAASHACAPYSYISTICLMSSARSDWYGMAPADGRQMSIMQYQAAYSLVGNTFGGDNQTYFKLPDLRGRIPRGAGYTNGAVGATGGATSVGLTAAMMPAHSHSLAAATKTLAPSPASVNLATVTGTANLSGGTFASTSNTLSLRAFSGTATGFAAGASALAAMTTTSQLLYASSAPNVDMAAASISGDLSVTIGSNAPVAIGNLSVPVGGTPAVNTSTSSIGSGAAFPTLPPYLAMTYFFILEGEYPVQDI